MNGIVRNFNTDRGFGFITPLIGKPDTTPAVFFHISAVKGATRGQLAAIPRGAEVKFILTRDDGGRVQAANVEIIEVSAATLQKQP